MIAPHSTILDTVAGIVTRSTPLTNTKVKAMGVFGRVALLFQYPFVDREAKDKRALFETLSLRCRDHGSNGWRQLLFFAEGTTTNGRALISFKHGAFAEGYPVQPVVLRLSTTPDTLTWTWKQRHTAWRCLLLTLSQCYVSAEMEFLPVYSPSAAEKADSELYARSVRRLMAEALGLPTVDLNYDDAKEAKKELGDEAPMDVMEMLRLP